MNKVKLYYDTRPRKIKRNQHHLLFFKIESQGNVARVLRYNDACSAVSSNEVEIRVYKTGTVTGPNLMQEGTRSNFAVSSDGDVVRWEYSTDDGNTWTHVNNTFVAYRHEITGPTKLRVLVDLGPFGQSYTNAFDVGYTLYTEGNANPTNGSNYVSEQQVIIAGVTNPNEVASLGSCGF